MDDITICNMTVWERDLASFIERQACIRMGAGTHEATPDYQPSGCNVFELMQDDSCPNSAHRYPVALNSTGHH